MDYLMMEFGPIEDSAVSCWECSQPAKIRNLLGGGSSVWQVVCYCGSRGVKATTKSEAESCYIGGEATTVGSARVAAAVNGLDDVWFESWGRFLSYPEQEMVTMEVFARDERLGFVYVMADIANHEVKIGGTSRLPGDRWKEHPRGLLPIAAFATRDWRATERLAHQQLASRRTSREEYFRVSIPLAIQAVVSAAMFDGSALFEVGIGNHLELLDMENS